MDRPALKHRHAAALRFNHRADAAALRRDTDGVADGTQAVDQPVAIARDATRGRHGDVDIGVLATDVGGGAVAAPKSIIEVACCAFKPQSSTPTKVLITYWMMVAQRGEPVLITNSPRLPSLASLNTGVGEIIRVENGTHRGSTKCRCSPRTAYHPLAIRPTD